MGLKVQGPARGPDGSKGPRTCQLWSTRVLTSPSLNLVLLSVPQSEAVWLPVLIHGATENQPPQVGSTASSVLEVDQFILTPLSTATLDAVDQETPQDRLVFNVTSPPADGFITHLEDHTKPVRSFTWLDLNHMKVAYQPPNSSHSPRRNYQVPQRPVRSVQTIKALGSGPQLTVLTVLTVFLFPW